MTGSILGESTAVRMRRIAIVVVAMIAVLLVAEYRRTPATGGAPGGTAIQSPESRIPAEADVFRTTPAELAVDPFSAPRAGARQRTLASFRALRAYPGAPPQIPHTLTPSEFREVGCNSCHMRGGWSERFGAYTPITPHPEFSNCLQCHGVNDGAVGVPTAGAGTPGLADSRPFRPAAQPFVPLDWRTTEWPRPGARAMSGSPPAIPHALELRGNCLSCHGGPGAVAEIRTTHPERANCRQCHGLANANEELFVRPRPGADPGGGEHR